jgi:Eco57I restriction-modification methylase
MFRGISNYMNPNSNQTSLGAFYTSGFIAKNLTQLTIYAWLNDLLSEKITYEEFLDVIKNPNSHEKEIVFDSKKLTQEFQNLKILDPSVGAGIFLLQSAHILELLYSKFQLSGLDGVELRKFIVKNHLFGWDINPEAIETSRKELYSWILNQKVEKAEKFPEIPDISLNENLYIVDTLQVESTFITQTKISMIIGNPPFGNLLKPVVRKKLKKTFKCRVSEIAELFVEQAIKILEHSAFGYLCFILPKTVSYYQKWAICRKMILEFQLYDIIDLGIAFKEVNFEEIAIILKIGENEHRQIDTWKFIPQKTYQKDSMQFLNQIDQKLLKEYETIIFAGLNEKETELIHSITKNCVFLPSIAKNYEKLPFSQDLKRSIYIPDKIKSKIQPGAHLFLNKVPDMENYCIKRLYKIQIPEKIERYNCPKLFFKVFRGSRLSTFADTNGNLISTEKIINFFPNIFYSSNLYALQLLLNCRPVSFFLQAILYNQTTETSRVLDAFYAKKIPIPSIEQNILFSRNIEFLNKLCKLIILAKYNGILTIFEDIVKIAESFVCIIYFTDLFKLSVQENIPLITENLTKCDLFGYLFSISKINDFNDIFTRIINEIVFPLPIKVSRISNVHLRIKIWQDSDCKTIQNLIEDINKKYQIHIIKKSWIYQTLINFLGK